MEGISLHSQRREEQSDVNTFGINTLSNGKQFATNEPAIQPLTPKYIETGPLYYQDSKEQTQNKLDPKISPVTVGDMFSPGNMTPILAQPMVPTDPWVTVPTRKLRKPE